MEAFLESFTREVLWVDEEEAQFLMALSQAYLEWERQTEQRGRVQGEQRGKAALILM